MGNLSFSRGISDPPAPTRNLPVFAILTVSCTIALTGCWLITMYVLRLFAGGPGRDWLNNPSVHGNNTPWNAVGMDNAPRDILMLSPFALVPSGLFALLMIWRWKKTGQAPGLKPILRQSAISALIITGALAAFVGWLYLDAVRDPAHFRWPRSTWMVFGIMIGSCLPAGLISGLIAYRYLKIMERPRV